jgi:hypothetical protein
MQTMQQQKKNVLLPNAGVKRRRSRPPWMSC